MAKYRWKDNAVIIEGTESSNFEDKPEEQTFTIKSLISWLDALAFDWGEDTKVFFSTDNGKTCECISDVDVKWVRLK